MRLSTFPRGKHDRKLPLNILANFFYTTMQYQAFKHSVLVFGYIKVLKAHSCIDITVLV